MKNSIKGALFSGLVFPGLGQFVLKRHQRGTVIVLTVLISLSILIVKIAGAALAIVSQIEMEGGLVDISEISSEATQLSTTSTELTLNFLLVVILSCWVFSTIDAYRIGKKMDAEKKHDR
jgi:hypothetical protein